MNTVALLLLLQILAPRIDVNTATKTELLTIEGISPTVADHIIRDRPYKTVEEVQGPVPRFLFEKIRERITVTSRPGIAATPSPITPSPVNLQPRREIQVISGKRIEKAPFEAREGEKAVEVPVDKSNPRP